MSLLLSCVMPSCRAFVACLHIDFFVPCYRVASLYGAFKSISLRRVSAYCSVSCLVSLCLVSSCLRVVSFCHVMVSCSVWPCHILHLLLGRSLCPHVRALCLRFSLLSLSLSSVLVPCLRVASCAMPSLVFCFLSWCGVGVLFCVVGLRVIARVSLHVSCSVVGSRTSKRVQLAQLNWSSLGGVVRRCKRHCSSPASGWRVLAKADGIWERVVQP